MIHARCADGKAKILCHDHLPRHRRGEGGRRLPQDAAAPAPGCPVPANLPAQCRASWLMIDKRRCDFPYRLSQLRRTHQRFAASVLSLTLGTRS